MGRVRLPSLLTMLLFPKPKARKRPSVAILGAREVCRTEASWQQRRKEVHDRANGACEAHHLGRRCNKPAPLHDVLETDTGEVAISAGHAHHKNGTRGLGGGKRDDSLGNLAWLCWKHHAQEHQPKKVVPRKVRA